MADRRLLIVGSWVAATLRSSTPLMMVTLGETLTQRVGIVNLGDRGPDAMWGLSRVRGRGADRQRGTRVSRPELSRGFSYRWSTAALPRLQGQSDR